MPTLLKRLWNIVTTVLVAAVVLLAVLLVGVRLVGLTPFVVLSGSMEPTYPTGERQVAHLLDVADVHAVHDVVQGIDQLGRDGGHRQPQQQGAQRVLSQIVLALGLQGIVSFARRIIRRLRFRESTWPPCRPR